MTQVLSASTLKGDKVVNSVGEDLGSIDELMIELETGKVEYAVLALGGFLGIGNKLFAVPWDVLHVDKDKKRFVLDVPRETLESAEGLDKSQWPDMADPIFRQRIFALFNVASRETQISRATGTAEPRPD